MINRNIPVQYLLSLVLYFVSCNNSHNTANKRNLESTESRIDTAIDSIVKQAPHLSNKEEKYAPLKIYAYSLIKYIQTTKEFTPRKVLAEGRYIGDRYFEPIIREESWKDVETFYVHFSPIQEYGTLTEDIKYQLLDEMERSIQNDHLSGQIRIISREVLAYSSYADASKAIERIKKENSLKSAGLTR